MRNTPTVFVFYFWKITGNKGKPHISFFPSKRGAEGGVIEYFSQSKSHKNRLINPLLIPPNSGELKCVFHTLPNYGKFTAIKTGS